MAKQLDVAVIVGSLRAASLSRKIALATAKLAPAELALSLVEIGALPLYNEELEQDVPAAWSAFRQRMQKADAVLFVTPEYNRSVPSALKNAIDVGSRPYGKSVFQGLPGAVISQSPGALGGFGANHHLRQSLVFLNVPVMQQPEAYLGNAAQLFDDAGELKAETTREFLTKFGAAFARWILHNPKHE